MSWPARERVILRCSDCKSVIIIHGYTQINEDYPTAERWAEVMQQRNPHKCHSSETAIREKLDTIAMVMKQIKKNNKLTFDEQCEVYKKLLKTYKL